MFSSRFLVIHNARRGREHNEPELSRRAQLVDPFLEVGETDVVTGGDHAAFVDSVFGCMSI